jgi:hypothetical protein
MTRKFGRLDMIKATFNPKLKHHLMSKYMYGKYEREPIQAQVQRGDQVYVRNVGQTRSDISFKQYVEINAGWKSEYGAEYNRLVREGKISGEQHYDYQH